MSEYCSADLSDHDFTGRDLTGADFSGANLQGTLFFDAVLRDVNFATARNLKSAQFGGADLSGASFPDSYEFPGVAHAGNITQTAKTVFFLMLLGSVIAWLTVANVSDGALIGNATRSTLPIIESEISIARFFLFAPVLLLLVYAYFAVHIQRVWEEITLLPAVFPDGRSVVRQLPHWLPIGIVRLFFEHLKGRKPPLIYLQISAVVVAIWLVQPFTMVLFGARYLITRDLTGLIILLFLFFLTALLSACSFVLTRTTLRGEFRHLVRRSRQDQSGPSRVRKNLVKSYGSGLLIATVLSLIFAAATWDYRNDAGVTRGFEASRFIRLLGFRYTAMIRETNLSHSQLDLSGRDLFEARFLDSEFSNGDFSGTDLSRAYLLRSRFDDVRFDGAIFAEVYVNGTSFRSSSFDLTHQRTANKRPGRASEHGFSGELMNSCLYRSYWTGDVKTAVFYNDSFRDAVFQQINMSKVFFTLSNLRGASFRRPRFDTVYFTNSDLRHAVFESIHEPDEDNGFATMFGSRLEGAYFRDVTARVMINHSNAQDAIFEGDISGLRFVDSNLRGADFERASNLGTMSFENVCVDGAKFPVGFEKPDSSCELWEKSGEEEQQTTTLATDFGEVCEASWVEHNVVGDLEHSSIVVEVSECVSCHGDTDSIGPPLKNLIGNVSGSSEEFDRDRYSETIKGMAVPWDEDTLDLYLRSPDRLIPGNRMRIVGIRDRQGRRTVVDWLHSLSRPEE